MKEKYEEPKITISLFECKDIISTSDGSIELPINPVNEESADSEANYIWR